MDPSKLPATPAAEQVKWVMSLDAEPSVAELEKHVVKARVMMPDLPGELLKLGGALRDLPGAVRDSGMDYVHVELGTEPATSIALVVVDKEHGNKITVAELLEGSMRDLPELERLQRLYDDYASSYEETVADVVHYLPRVQSWLRDVVQDGFVVLDVGCGPANLTANLPGSVVVYGSDLSPEMIRLARERRPTGTFIVHDYHAPFPAEWPRADVTIAIGCLDVSSDLGQVIRNLAAATASDGRLLLTVPRVAAGSDGATKHELTFPGYEVSVRLRSDAEVAQALRDAGLEVISHEIAPGFTAAVVGSAEYGIWDLKHASVS